MIPDLLIDAVRFATPAHPDILIPNLLGPKKIEPGPSWNDFAVELFRSHFLDQKFAVPVSSGTAALHLALLALNVGPGDLVVVPSLTFVAAAAVVRYCGAEPLFADCINRPFGALNGFKLHRHIAKMPIGDRKRIRAIIAVDLLGHMGVTGDLMWCARTFGIPVIEDAAGALGSTFVGAHKPSIVTYSFNCNKIITGYGGGIVLTDDQSIHDRVDHLSKTARSSALYYVHDAVGFNYRMPIPCAQIASHQMDFLPNVLEAKHALMVKYSEALRGSDWRLIRHSGDEIVGGIPNYWLNAVTWEGISGGPDVLDDAMLALRRKNIACRPMFTPLHLLPPYRNCPRQENLLVAEIIAKNTICIPSGVSIDGKD